MYTVTCPELIGGGLGQKLSYVALRCKLSFFDNAKTNYLGQAANKDLTFIITGDINTLAKYCRTLHDLSLLKPELIVISEGFSAGYFNGGQAALIDEDI